VVFQSTALIRFHVGFALMRKYALLSSMAFITAAQSPPASMRTVTIAFGAAS
jgi:hypothetical protein